MFLSVTKTVQISCTAAAGFSFLADPANMPKWAIHNLKSIKPGGTGGWEIETPRGPGRFIPHFDAGHGVLDHEFIDPKEGSWAVPARIVAIGPVASVYMITLTKPEGMSAEAFMEGMGLMDDELQKLKDVLESNQTTD
jgi:hypothetical protein